MSYPNFSQTPPEMTSREEIQWFEWNDLAKNGGSARRLGEEVQVRDLAEYEVAL
jgi:hypothetical protein